jgi:hypothetical protein
MAGDRSIAQRLRAALVRLAALVIVNAPKALRQRATNAIGR